MPKFKISTEVRYNNDTFQLTKKDGPTRLFFNEEHNCCLVVNEKDEILFELQVAGDQGFSFIKLIENEG